MEISERTKTLEKLEILSGDLQRIKDEIKLIKSIRYIVMKRKLGVFKKLNNNNK